MSRPEVQVSAMFYAKEGGVRMQVSRDAKSRVNLGVGASAVPLTLEEIDSLVALLQFFRNGQDKTISSPTTVPADTHVAFPEK